MHEVKGESILNINMVSGVQLKKSNEILESFVSFFYKFEVFLVLQNVPMKIAQKT